MTDESCNLIMRLEKTLRNARGSTLNVKLHVINRRTFNYRKEKRKHVRVFPFVCAIEKYSRARRYDIITWKHTKVSLGDTRRCVLPKTKSRAEGQQINNKREEHPPGENRHPQEERKPKFAHSGRIGDIKGSCCLPPVRCQRRASSAIAKGHETKRL